MAWRSAGCSTRRFWCFRLNQGIGNGFVTRCSWPGGRAVSQSWEAQHLALQNRKEHIAEPQMLADSRSDGVKRPRRIFDSEEVPNPAAWGSQRQQGSGPWRWPDVE